MEDLWEMNLQKRLSRKLGKKIYSKWVVTIPPDVVKKLDWKEGQKLSLKVRKGKVVLEQK